MLKRGTEAFALVGRETGNRSRSGARSTLEGAARVRIKERSDDGYYTAEIVAGSGVPEGFARRFKRCELFVTEEERQYFKQLVGYFWAGELITLERPKSLDEEK